MYVAILIVCSMAIVGDNQCIQFFDSPRIHYRTLSDCKKRLRTILESVEKAPQKMAIPGPWRFRGHCQVPIIDERKGA